MKKVCMMHRHHSVLLSINSISIGPLGSVCNTVTVSCNSQHCELGPEHPCFHVDNTFSFIANSFTATCI